MNYRVVIREVLHRKLANHLLRGLKGNYKQEEACLALWFPGDGKRRYTAIISEVLLPSPDDRDLHGNVTIRGAFLNRAVDLALRKNAGVAVLHSHPARGWQRMSVDDYDTEKNLILPFVRETGLPLLSPALVKVL